MLTTNLLPLEEKRIVRLEEARRAVQFFAVASVVVLLFGVVLLLPSYLSSVVATRALAHLQELEKESAAHSNFSDVIAANRDAARIIAQVKTFVEIVPKAAPLLEKFLQSVPGITIEALSVRKEGIVTMQGIARTRTDLLGLEQSFREANLFDAFRVPLSSIVQEEDIRFTVQGTLKTAYRL